MSVVFSLLAAGFWGAANFAGGSASRRSHFLSVTLWAAGTNAGFVLLLALAFRNSVNLSDLAWGAACGLGVMVGMTMMFRGMALGSMSMVAPLVAVESALVLCVVGLIKGETLSFVGSLGALAVVVAIVLLTRPSPAAASETTDAAKTKVPNRRAALFSAVVAGLAFGIGVSFLTYTSGESGVWPLVSQRAVIVLVLVSVMLTKRMPLALPSDTQRFAISSGLLQGAGDVLFLFAIYEGSLSLASVLSGLHVAGTVLLARFILKEQLSHASIAGLLFALSGATLLTLS